MTSLLQDLRFAIRQLRKSPGFTVTAVLTLALAVGAASAVFSVIYAVLIRPLPYDHPEKIFYLKTYVPQGYQQPSSYPEYLDWQRENHVFSALAGYSTIFFSGSSNFEGPSGPVALSTVATTDNFFDVFGVHPLIGRTFAPGKDQPGKNDVVVLSYEVWQQNFGGQRTALGQTVKLNGSPSTVIGVMPAGFRFPVDSLNAIYTPIHIPKVAIEHRDYHWMETIARLKPGFSVAQAQADMNRVLNNLGNAYPDESKGRRMKLADLTSFVVEDTAPALKVLILAVLAVLAIGCVNIAGLLLARGVKREREIALRSAVGASRVRLVRQMLTESILLAVLGAAGGILLAYALLNAIRSLLIAAVSRGTDVQMKPVLLATLAIAVFTSLLAGLVPALRLSGIAPYLAIKSGERSGSSRGQQRLRASFIITQVALALVLLVVSGLLLRALAGLRNADLGFNPDHLQTTEIYLSPGTYQGRNLLADFYRPLLEKVQAIPGVKAAGIIQMLPIQATGWNGGVDIVGHPPAPANQERLAEIRVTTPGYFKAFGISLVRGRMLDETIDTLTSPRVTVVNEAFVKKFFDKGEDPIGKHINDDDKTTIVGVVRSVRQDIFSGRPLPEMDTSISQIPVAQMPVNISHMQLVVSTSVEPESIVPSLRHAFHEVDPGLPFRQPETMRNIVAHALIFQRLENWLFGTFASLAVLLAIVGLYGLISHEVELSSRDIGIRLALGATRVRVLAGVYRRVGVLLVLGVAIGLLVTAAVQKLLAAVLIIHANRDAPEVVALAAGLIFAGLLAALIPARRAAKVDPMVALRYE